MSFEQIVKLKRETTTEENAVKWQITLIGIIANGLIEYLNFLTRQNTMSREQVMETAKLIYEEYPYMTVYDVSLFTRLCKTEHFGELRDLNGSVFIRWYKMYFKERFDKLNDFRYKQEQEQLKSQTALPEPEMSQEEIDERIKRIANRLRANRKVESQQSVHVKPATDRVKAIRLRVIRQNTNLLSLPDYDKRIGELIEQAMKDEGLLEEYNKLKQYE